MNIKEFIDDIDCDENILSITYKKHYVWPIIRYQVIQQIINYNNKIADPKVGAKISFKNLLIGVGYGIVYLPIRVTKNSILIFSNSLSLFLNENNRYKNKLFDYFIKYLPTRKILFIEESNNEYKHLTNKEIEVALISKNLLTFIVELFVKLNFIFLKHDIIEANNKVNTILNISKTHISNNCITGSHESVVQIQKSLVKQLIRANIISKYYNLFFSKGGEKLVFHEDGHYGGEKAIINFYAHKANKIVVEPQHGFINSNHPVYYFGEKFCKNEILKQYYPDYFLTYGKFWSKSARVPNEIIDIGNPHLDTLSNKIDNSLPKQKRILIIGSGVNINETNALLQLALNNSNGYEIYYRPHPQETTLHKDRYLASYKLGLIEDKDQLYNSLVASEIVIAEMSTVLFESIIFCNNVFLFKSNYTKAYYNDLIKYFNEIDFSNFDDVFKFSNTNLNKEAIKYYWETNWETNFCNFLFKIKQEQ
jgi:hypothetical protein